MEGNVFQTTLHTDPGTLFLYKRLVTKLGYEKVKRNNGQQMGFFLGRDGTGDGEYYRIFLPIFTINESQTNKSVLRMYIEALAR